MNTPLSRDFLLERGSCCNSNCINCPYNKNKTMQKLPKWFTGELYEEGGTVQNRFSGEEAKLTAAELSMYDFIMGATMMMEMGILREEALEFGAKDLKKGMDWFRENNAKAYMVLLD
jgi:hypothetical protein